ncbi:alpha/beta fold hydrolase [Streptomyces griseoloalbus]|uniref:Pimeloyl-ACP methyl ester carboxylesterase n=1 Tax=Streptomyces griseoloalbus TaxID=67303 RepID=A0A7W8BLV4_9ACTN|nr:alpha/beta hydrolase [Streptomyces albaduncus]MBB5125781.1 pimeloyl-ACP methyl ester carboxylesterase [Streptomyces albaduncus]GGV65075.1 hydrolase [Streptomyces griseoloalbus]GGW55229.1 hydrolase [Streptomyces albaduncus]
MTGPSELRFFPSADGDLAYLDTGSGDPVVLLHSGYVDHRVWDAQIPALAAHHRVIAPDVRGHGFSANATEPFRWADDLAGLLRHLDAGPVVLVGLSMGGVIATDTVLEHPGLVRAVVTCGAATGDVQYTDPWYQEVQAESARALAAGDVQAWLAAFLRVVPGPHRTADDVDPDILRRLREMALHTISKHTPGEKNLLVPVTGTWSRLPEIDVPVLAVNGALEPADPRDAAQRLAEAVPDGRAVTIDGTGHYPNMERPELFNRTLLDFLRAL